MSRTYRTIAGGSLGHGGAVPTQGCHQRGADPCVGPYKFLTMQNHACVISICKQNSSCFTQASHYVQCRLRDFSPLPGVRNDILCNGYSLFDVISREPRSGDRETLGCCSGGHPLSNKCHPCATRSSNICHAEQSEASRSSNKRFLLRGTRFFGTSCLRMTLARNLLFRESNSVLRLRSPLPSGGDFAG